MVQGWVHVFRVGSRQGGFNDGVDLHRSQRHVLTQLRERDGQIHGMQQSGDLVDLVDRTPLHGHLHQRAEGNQFSVKHRGHGRDGGQAANQRMGQRQPAAFKTHATE
ncbi:hypothetical protein D3C84_981770 [compost metagenome]